MFPTLISLTAAVALVVSPGQDPQPPDPPEPPPEPLPVLVGEGYRAEVDFETARVRVMIGDDGAALSIPLGLAWHPSREGRSYRLDDSAEPVKLTGLHVEEGRPTLGAALFQYVTEGVEGAVSAGVRTGTQGLLLMYAIPRSHLLAVDGPRAGELWVGRTPAGTAPRVGGQALPRAVTLRAPGRWSVALSDLLEPDAVGLRLQGEVAIEDSSPGAARLRIQLGGEEVFDSGSLRTGDAPARIDVPLREVGVLDLELEASDGEAALAVLSDVVIRDAGRLVALDEGLRATQPSLDLLVDADGRGVLDGPLAAAPIDRTDGAPTEPFIDTSVENHVGLRPPPLLIPLELEGGVHVGIGLANLPDATRLSWATDRLSLAIPAALVGREYDADDQLRVQLTVVFASSRAELLRRYREMLHAIGGAGDIRESGGLTLPSWWRLPMLFAEPPRFAGRFARFDAYSVEKLVARVEQELGLSEFTLVIDGPWYDRAGDPTPNADFHALRSLIAEQHFSGRRVLLAWDPIAAEEGTFADIAQVLGAEGVDATNEARYRAYATEVARRCLSDQLDALGADGLVLHGLEGLRDPSRSISYAAPGRGVGLRELALVLKGLHAGVRVAKRDAMLIAPVAAPQLYYFMDALLLPVSGSSAISRAARSDDLIAIAPDLPWVAGPLAPSDEDPLRWACRTVAGGVPSLGSRSLDALDAGQRSALGAILSLAAPRRLGVPETTDDGRVVMKVDGRVLAESLSDDAAVIVYPNRDEALLAVVEDGDLVLPFAPSAMIEAHDASIHVADDGVATLVGARAGVVYRLRR